MFKLFCVLFPLLLLAACGSSAPRVTAVSGEFYFDKAGSGDTPVQFSWDETYFAAPASVYNPSLASMSMTFAMSAFASTGEDPEDFKHSAGNAVDLLTQIGFRDIEANYYFSTRPHKDSMGVVAAHKYIEAGSRGYTLIAVAARGGGYGAEWASNFTVGAESYHAGFKNSTEIVYDFLADFISRHGANFEDDIKIWLTGFSRGGAVANLLAARISYAEEIAALPVDAENIFAYTFAAPKPAPLEYIEARNFSNIHNIINPSDVVSWVAPYAWGFGRYGTDHFMPEPENQEAFEAVRFGGINLFPPGIIIAHENQPMSEFTPKLADILAASAISREHYAERFEPTMRKLAADLSDGKPLADRLDYAMENFFAKFSLQNAPEIISAFRASGVEGVTALAAEFFFDSLISAGVPLEHSAVLIELIREAFAYGGLNNMLTAIHNLRTFEDAHHPELMLAWLISEDINCEKDE